ncbi:carbohydrate-binding domain-containing protein [Devosia sp.]|uniref:carbohydrate-binding domain-containing protein n=1 Tax=Devosia sp. TaxID=1871048 RepID=UPI003BAC2E52
MKTALALAAALMATASVSAAELSIDLSGTAFEGGPAFELRMGKTVIGSGTIDPVPPDGQPASFLFDVPDAVLAEGKDLVVRFTNDKWQGAGQDRNLYVLFARVNGKELSPEDFHLMNKDGPVARKVRQGRLEIWSGLETAVAPPPAEGWIAGVAQAAPAPEPAPAAAAPVDCSLSLAVTGIASRAAALTEAQAQQLEPLLAAARSGKCAVVLTGYASQGGAEDLNIKASGIRAQLVLDYLTYQGAKFTTQTIVPFGSTSTFGSDDASNQRVNVRLETTQ